MTSSVDLNGCHSYIQKLKYLKRGKLWILKVPLDMFDVIVCPSLISYCVNPRILTTLLQNLHVEELVALCNIVCYLWYEERMGAIVV